MGRSGVPAERLPSAQSAAGHPVLHILRARRALSEEGQGPPYSDGYRLGLAIEGGGMRGIISGAMLSAIEDLGFAMCFDRIYGTSSGAINGAYLPAGNIWYFLSIYYDDLTTRQFVDFRRPLFGKDILDLDYAFGEIVVRRKPLDTAPVLASRKLCVGVTDVDQRRTLAVDDFDSPEDLISALVASSWLPIAKRGVAVFRGARCLDGGLLLPHAYRMALQDGCSHVLSLSTRPAGAWLTHSRVGVGLLARYLDGLSHGLGPVYRDAMVQRDQDQAFLDRETFGNARTSVLDLRPPASAPIVGRHEMNKATLLGAARESYALVHSALSSGRNVDGQASMPSVIPRLTAVPTPPHRRAVKPVGGRTVRANADIESPRWAGWQPSRLGDPPATP